MRLHQALRTRYRYRRRSQQPAQSSPWRPGPEWIGGAEFIDHDPSVALTRQPPPPPPPGPPPALPSAARLEIEEVDPRFVDAIVAFLVSSGFTVTTPAIRTGASD